jgi:DNA-binding transcriptional ArsR family regulator
VADERRLPASFVLEDARPRLPSADLVDVLRALGNDTRLRALRLIAERPRSTQELARLVGISEAGLSKHLRQLSAAGLVTTRREGYYVLYAVVRERIGPLSDVLLGFLGEEVARGEPESPPPQTFLAGVHVDVEPAEHFACVDRALVPHGRPGFGVRHHVSS